MEEGRVYLSLPLHCTLARFVTDKPTEEVLAAAWPKFAKSPAIALRAGKPSRFGSGKRPRRIEVNLVDKTHDLNMLQMELYNALNKLEVQYSNPRYVGLGYKPHISKRGGDAVEEGTELVSRAVYFIEVRPSAHSSSHKFIHARVVLGKGV